jgi:hypothetical protein
MYRPKMASVGIAAALLLFSALLFGERAEAYSDRNEERVQAESDGRYYPR